MFEEMARLRFFSPKPFVKLGKYTDKYPFVVMESVTDTEKVVIGKFPEEKYAKLFLGVVRSQFVTRMQAEMAKAIDETIGEN